MTGDQRTTTIWTVGHSVHGIARFLELLRGAAVALVVDTRARPYSRFNPHFNRERLREALEGAGIAYLWRGAALSGRPAEKRFYRPDGALDLDELWRWPALQAGIDEVAAEAGTKRTALLCAEEDPLICHRRFLLTPPLLARGAAVLHIRGDGRIEPEPELAAREAVRPKRSRRTSPAR
jgi:uncharacterized protein (DUF488 family)